MDSEINMCGSSEELLKMIYELVYKQTEILSAMQSNMMNIADIQYLAYMAFAIVMALAFIIGIQIMNS